MLKRGIVACVAAATLSACSFAPPYQAPEAVIPTAFKEAGPWQTAKPADRVARDGWWKVYNDPVLNDLEANVEKANPDVAAAVARHDQAEAFVQQARSGLFPTIGAGASVSRQRQSDNRPLRGSNQPSVYNSADVDVGIGYDLDLWGKVRNEVKAGIANEQASADDLQSLRLSLQASLADHYFRLRALDERTRLLQETIVTYQHALELTESRHSGGLASGMDVSRAQTQLASAKAAVDDTAASRAVLEHAIASLTGMPASDFSLASVTSRYSVPQVPVGVPSRLLQRRPDIAAAERRVAAANSNIGVTKAAFFPDISLGLSGGYQSDTLSPWLAAPNEIWSIGPQLMFALFDGGRRSAAVADARAKLAENGAKYRSVVLTAFQQVEDELALLHHLGDESKNQDEALASARSTLKLASLRYKDGAVSYLDVVTAQTTELDAQVSSLDLRTRQLTASVNLIQALGGSW